MTDKVASADISQFEFDSVEKTGSGQYHVKTGGFPLALPGATTPTRYVGRHDGGAPTTGAFAVGDFTTDVTTPAIWVCSVAGTPGTWVQAGGGGGLPSWFQSGSGSPRGTVTPAQKGALYQDTANGGLFIATGVTNTDWFILGGFDSKFATSNSSPGVFWDGSHLNVSTPTGHEVQITDQASQNGGTGNAWGWLATAGDGAQEEYFEIGSTGQMVWERKSDGTSTFPGPLVMVNGNALYNTATVPAAGVGSNGDWALTGDGSLCRKVSGAWVVVVSEAPGFRSLTTPPVSTTVYQNTTGFDLTASLRAVLAVNPALASDCKVEISPDNFASAQVWADPALAAGALAVANAPEYIEFPIPANWYYKVTATNATIGALVAIG